jgi:hypothetical protein
MKPQNHLCRLGVQLLLVVGATCLLFQSARADLLFSEGFSYPAPTNLASGACDSWMGGNATNLGIVSGSLSYPGLTGLSGANSLHVLTVKSTVDSNIFTASPVTSGSLYYSFLIRPSAAATNNSYITMLDPPGGPANGGGDALAVYYGTSLTANQNRIGVRTTGGGSGASYSGTELTLNTTYFIVTKYAFNYPGAGQSTVSIWVNPTVGGSEGTADATEGGTVISSIGVVDFKAQTVAPGEWAVDDLRIGTTWADVNPVPEPSTLALLGLGVLGLVFARRMRH